MLTSTISLQPKDLQIKELFIFYQFELVTFDSFFINWGSYSQVNFNMLEVLPSTLKDHKRIK